MSILSEQSVASSGAHRPKDAPLTDPKTLGQTALPTQPLSESANPNAESTAASAPPRALPSAATEPLSKVNQQQRLQYICQHPSLHSGDLSVAAAVITQVSVEVLSVDRVSLWLYDAETSLQLCDSYDVACKVHASGVQIAAADFADYFETLQQREGLQIENVSASCGAFSTSMQPLEGLIRAGLLSSGAFLELPVRTEGKLVGVLWCELAQPHRWTALQQANSVAISLLTAMAVDARQRHSMSSTLTHQRRQLKRETIEREQAEQAWQESQRFIQGIIDASTNILYVDSFADGSNFYISRWIQNVLGYTPADVQKMGPHYLEKLVHADEKPQMATERKKLAAINDGEVVENEYRFRHRQGNWRWLLCRETVFQRDEDGQPTQVFGTATDITKRKHAEVALKEFNEELARLASMDGLTQVANRRSFDEYLVQEWANVGSGRSALSLILCDIDYFKSFNDTYGHQAGDVCLRKVAKAIERAVKRSTDLVARYGGEEFAIVLPNTNAAGVERVAQDIQQEIKTLAIPHSQSDVSDCITLSLGIASVTTTANSHPDMLVACADQGLYQAKYEGRDRYSLGEIEYP